jgi:hypothetical protein
MGTRSPKGTAAPQPPATTAAHEAARVRPVMLTVAAIVLVLEAVGLGVAGILIAADTAAGRSYHASNGVALTILDFILVAGLVWIASGVARLRPWSRTPAGMIQVFSGVVAVYLLQAHRFDWGVPALLLAIAGLVALLTPASLRALTRTVSRE